MPGETRYRATRLARASTVYRGDAVSLVRTLATFPAIFFAAVSVFISEKLICTFEAAIWGTLEIRLLARLLAKRLIDLGDAVWKTGEARRLANTLANLLIASGDAARDAGEARRLANTLANLLIAAGDAARDAGEARRLANTLANLLIAAGDAVNAWEGLAACLRFLASKLAKTPTSDASFSFFSLTFVPPNFILILRTYYKQK